MVCVVRNKIMNNKGYFINVVFKVNFKFGGVNYKL